MDVDAFIAKYGPEWRRLEASTAGGARGLARRGGEEVAETVRLYLRTSVHLAEAQTIYGDARLEAYLNGVVSRAHGTLYGSDPHSIRDLARTFGSRYVAAARRTLPFILAAAAVLIVVSAAMTIWVATSREAQAGILPPFAQEAIRNAPASGERADLGVAPSSLSTYIMLNNIQVAFFAFALGIGFGIGTIWALVLNATMLGSLAGAYQSAGRTGTFWALVLPHGLLEITAICIAAGAGLRIGWSLIDPGDAPRGRALADAARDSVLVLVGVIPAFIVAALIEGFLTGHTGVPALEVAVGVIVAVAYVLLVFGRQRRSTVAPTP